MTIAQQLDALFAKLADTPTGREAAAEASAPPAPTRVPTLRQYAESRWTEMRQEYGTTLTEAKRLYPVSGFEAEWFRAVTAGVESGLVPSGKLWRSLTDHQQHGLLRTRRALSDQEFTRKLVLLGL